MIYAYVYEHFWGTQAQPSLPGHLELTGENKQVREEQRSAKLLSLLGDREGGGRLPRTTVLQ